MQTLKILGPPGTGKTTKLLSIVETELKKVRPDELAYVSFTRTGAYEGRDRAIEKFGFSAEELPYFRTLHSIAYHEQKLARGQMIGREQVTYLGGKLGMDFSANPASGDFSRPDDAYFIFDALEKDNPHAAQKQKVRLNMRKLQYFQHNYRAFKQQFQMFDFSDLISLYVRTGKPLPVKVAIVDEAQDLTTLQWEMVRKAFANVDRLYIAGDDDQCLTAFAGADVNEFLRFRGAVEVLAQSYRVPLTIQEYAARIAGAIHERDLKEYKGRDYHGELRRVSSPASLELSGTESWFLLGRNRWHLKRYTDMLRQKGIMYTTRTRSGDFPSVKPAVIKQINTYEAVRKGREPGRMLAQVKLRPGASLDLPWYRALDLPDSEIAYYRRVIENDAKQDASRIIVSTIHAVKGAEADHVALLLDMTRQVFGNYTFSPDDELRAYYVGATRSRETLTLIDSESKYFYPVV